MHASAPLPQGIEILGKSTPEFAQILTAQALAFVAKLARKFEPRRRDLIALRARRLAAFEMEEILHELREHSSGLNIGRWDYIFSCIKNFRSNRNFCLADRAQVTMTAPFMRAYALQLVRACHKRNTFAMGGMAAQIPVKDDLAANRRAIDKVRADKIREVTDGCDGTWVAHPGLVEVARTVFDKHMRTPVLA